MITSPRMLAKQTTRLASSRHTSSSPVLEHSQTPFFGCSRAQTTPDQPMSPAHTGKPKNKQVAAWGVITSHWHPALFSQGGEAGSQGEGISYQFHPQSRDGSSSEEGNPCSAYVEHEFLALCLFSMSLNNSLSSSRWKRSLRPNEPLKLHFGAWNRNARKINPSWPLVSLEAVQDTAPAWMLRWWSSCLKSTTE